MLHIQIWEGLAQILELGKVEGGDIGICGIVDGEILLDLAYEEDSRADVDMNFVMTAGRKFVDVQATAEHQVFDEPQLGKMMALAGQGVQALIAKQQAILGTLTLRQ